MRELAKRLRHIAANRTRRARHPRGLRSDHPRASTGHAACRRATASAPVRLDRAPRSARGRSRPARAVPAGSLAGEPKLARSRCISRPFRMQPRPRPGSPAEPRGLTRRPRGAAAPGTYVQTVRRPARPSPIICPIGSAKENNMKATEVRVLPALDRRRDPTSIRFFCSSKRPSTTTARPSRRSITSAAGPWTAWKDG